MSTSQGIFSHLSVSYGKRSVAIFKQLCKECVSERRIKNRIKFLHQCIEDKLLPRSLWFRLPGRHNFDIKMKAYIGKRLLHKEIGRLTQSLHVTRTNIECRHRCFQSIVTDHILYGKLLEYLNNSVMRDNNLHVLNLEERLKRLRSLHGVSDASEQTVSSSAPSDDPQNCLITDLTGSLNADEIDILQLGPKFALTDPVNKTTLVDFNVNFCRFSYQLRWQHILKDRLRDPCAVPKYPWHTRLKMPSRELRDDDLEDKLRRIYFKCKRVVQRVDFKPSNSNLSPDERLTLARLKEKPFFFLPSDKGGEFCVIESSMYTQLGVEHLTDESSYAQISHITPKTIETRINSTWKKIAHDNEIPGYITRSLITSNSTIPKFYHLIKTHKPGSTIKIRPIVSNSNGPTKKIAWLLTRIFTPFLSTIPAHLENSLQLINAIEEVPDISSRDFLCSFDIVSMYPSIPVPEAIENAITKLEEHPNTHITNLPTDCIEKLLRVVLQNTYFEFNGHIFKQIKGLPMGSSLSGILAILYIDSIERIALQSISPEPFFRRYVDDCFAMVQDRTQANVLFQALNNVDRNIKFEIEFPANDGSLSLLDFQVSVSNGRPVFSFYKKSARKNIFVNFRSHLPSSTKHSIIMNERKRIAERCSFSSTQSFHNRNFDNILKSNGYPDHVIQDTNKSKPTHKRVQNDIKYIKLPFISDEVDHKLKRIFKQEGINIRIAHKTRSLRNFLQRRKETLCSLSTCIMKTSNICHKRNVVYKIVCRNCQNFYIGSTIRFLHLRIREHMTTKDSSVYKHIVQCGGGLGDLENKVDVYIIGSDFDEANLRLREATLISFYRPQINSKSEMEAFREFLYL